jgi:hypothetical protein
MDARRTGRGEEKTRGKQWLRHKKGGEIRNKK